MIGYAANLAAKATLPRQEFSAAGTELAFHAAAGLVLLVPVYSGVQVVRAHALQEA